MEIISLLTHLQSRSITVEGLDSISECHLYTEDIESMQPIFDKFLKLDCSTDVLLVQAVNFESLLMELKAYDIFKRKKKKVMHLVLKTLDIATGT